MSPNVYYTIKSLQPPTPSPTHPPTLHFTPTNHHSPLSPYHIPMTAQVPSTHAWILDPYTWILPLITATGFYSNQEIKRLRLAYSTHEEAAIGNYYCDPTPAILKTCQRPGLGMERCHGGLKTGMGVWQPPSCPYFTGGKLWRDWEPNPGTHYSWELMVYWRGACGDVVTVHCTLFKLHWEWLFRILKYFPPLGFIRLPEISRTPGISFSLLLSPRKSVTHLNSQTLEYYKDK